MQAGQRLWTKDELMLAINLYSKLTFGQLHQRNPSIVELANLIDRTPASVTYKLVNFASLDSRLKQKGMSNTSKLDREVWQEYLNNWDEQFIESEQLLAKRKNSTIEKINRIDITDLEGFEGKERERLVRQRVNQCLFRELVLSNFDGQCCITGITITELIVASHILPWSKDKKNQLNPANGLALNCLHDKAFDRGLLTITTDLKIKISNRFYQHKDLKAISQNFISVDGQGIIEPKKIYPDLGFLKIHNDTFKE